MRRAAPPRDALLRAIGDYRELFRPEQLERLQQGRRLALEAMHNLAAFNPRLFGALSDGDGPLDRVSLLVTADTPEQVLLYLHDRRIPWQEATVEMQHHGHGRREHAAARFIAGDSEVELVILPPWAASDPPRDSLDDRPLASLDAGQLERLLRDA